MWKEMVIDTGIKAGKIKIVLADAGFFAYIKLPAFHSLQDLCDQNEVQSERYPIKKN